MAQLKQLSAGSSQIIMMMFRDKNNAPIKADSVHVKGSIFTGSGKPFEFEVNKGFAPIVRFRTICCCLISFRFWVWGKCRFIRKLFWAMQKQ